MSREQTPPEIPRLLTAVEVSKAIRVSPRQIRSLLTRPGALPRHVQIGQRRFWLESVVADWLAAGGEKQGGAA
jgi:predicted DNA-binding transcriptional regulator AlpA